ncbi:ABC-three component system protein [Achromobacter xylosoxidans]|uniref:ABC-three component system protein n=1 Tax=Alcaligenes xylosoxydans xylosoxydans TaxID=85698 RepID=UPI00211B4A43|nr:ABC-three component system protein [Achromobacter xylosoxidans]
MSPDQWEKFIEVACVSRILDEGTKYAVVKQMGGAGDGGRDVEARLEERLITYRWDLYQAKHYDHPLSPTDVFKELVKVFKNIDRGTYPPPRNYYLCAPQGVGPDLHNLLADPAKFKGRFLTDWEGEKTGLRGRRGELTASVRTIVEYFDFGSIVECQTRTLLEWHAHDRKAHFELFGIESVRGDDPIAPAAPDIKEEVYISQLLRVYGELAGANVTLDELMQSDHGEHFQSHRATFYCAEGLKTFSRDLFGEEEFDALLDMVYAGIRARVTSPRHRLGLDRLEAGTDGAQALTVSDSVLAPKLRPGDLPGTCHHLANAKRLQWVK